MSRLRFRRPHLLRSSCPMGTLRVVVLLALPLQLSAENWPQWRGPEGTSVTHEKGLAINWSEVESPEGGSAKGIEWKCKLPQWGNSTPAIWGDAIFLTSHEDDALLLVKISKKTQAIEWTRRVGSETVLPAEALRKTRENRVKQQFHKTHNLASPSPVTDGKHVVVHFGNGILASFDYRGNLKWKRNLQDDYGTYTIWWGHANSPVLHEELVISVCMQDSLKDLRKELSPSYVVAHDKSTGKVVWKTSRMTGANSEPCDAYTTPLFHSTEAGPEMIVVGGTWVDAYNPSNGKQLWCLPDVGGNRTITGPTLVEDMLYFTVGMRGPVTALKLGRKGKLPQSDIVWRHSQSTPDSPCPVYSKNLLFIVNDGGYASCLDAKTGDRHWKERLKGSYRASPLAAEGRIYFTNMSGTTTVIDAATEFRVVARNKIKDTTIASLAVSDGRLYLRGHEALYCIR